MAYQQFVPLENMNFQINRLYTYGEKACREDDLWEIAPKLSVFNFQVWYKEWNNLAIRAESEDRLMHAAYYHRLSEFFLPDDRPEKLKAYQDFRRCFYQVVGNEPFEQFDIPYEGKTLPALRMKATDEKGVIVIHGGFDSFVEEFYLQLKEYPKKGYTLIAFEGPGQGRTLRDGMKMIYQWEKPVSVVLDYFGLDGICLIGVSLGGYLGLRAAAFEPRIQQVVAYNVVWDAQAIFTRNLPDAFRQLILDGKSEEVNAMIEAVRKTDDLVDWAVSHGMYITGAQTPYEYLDTFSNFKTRDISALVKQDVLLLAGENDHFVPVEFFELQKKALTNVRSLSGRVFTKEEGGDQHCQVGNLELASNEILTWLGRFY